MLRLAFSGPKIVKSPADVMAIIWERTADILSADELALVIRLPAIEGPVKPKPKRRRTSKRVRTKTARKPRRRAKTGKIQPISQPGPAKPSRERQQKQAKQASLT